MFFPSAGLRFFMGLVQTIPQDTFSRFFGAVRRAIDADDWRCADPVGVIAHGSLSNCPDGLKAAHEKLRLLPLEWREHAAAVVAAIQLKAGERERLGAYFTPPHLASHILSRLIGLGYDPTRHTIIDPAAGGAAFLAPLHGLITRSLGRRSDTAAALKLLRGIEIDRRLAKVTKDILAWRIALLRGDEAPSEKDFVASGRCVEIGDTLAKEPTTKFDVVIGNPPYARIGKDSYAAFVERWPELTDKGGYLNLSMAFLHHCVNFVKPGGLLSFVMPAGIIGGPSFSAFRKSVAAEVVALDRIEKRERVFLDVIQDCIIVTMRRGVEKRNSVMVGSLRGDGTASKLGTIKLDLHGAAWQLPSNEVISTGRSLSERGWRGRIGPVVPHRWKDRVSGGKPLNSLPLIWAPAIRPDGTIDYPYMCKRVEGYRVSDVDPEVSYVIRKPCLVVQRTANRKQKKRINAAVIDAKFLNTVGPFVAENHVIVLTPPDKTSIGQLRKMAGVLNSTKTTSLYDRVSGTANVSVKTLLAMKLPRSA
jgi:adenine-specific DNA-methyltransferase